jgi:glycosyltransferase involved in cell wall biosynthesis
MSVYREYEYVDSSICSVLNQTFSDFEFIIIDDSNEEEMHLKLVKWADKDKRIKLVANDVNIGLTRSLNRGLALSEGAYVARIDADDICLPVRFEKQLCYLLNNKNIVLLGGCAKVISSNDRIIGTIEPNTENSIIMNHHFFRNQFVHPTVMFDRCKILEIGGYNENLQAAQDWELWARVIKQYDVANLPDYLILYRMHDQSITSTKNNKQRKAVIKYLFFHIYIYRKISFLQFVFGNFGIVKNMLLSVLGVNHSWHGRL